MKFQIWGHRGSGASDAPFNQDRDREAGVKRPDENTIKSHLQALRNGANGIETDLIETKDNNIVLVHANDYGQHIIDPGHHNEITKTKPFIHELAVAEIQTDLEIGKEPGSRIPTLGQLLKVVKNKFPRAILNLELKGLQDTRKTHQNISLTTPSLAEKAFRIIKENGFPQEQIRFSSFSLDYLAEMAEIDPDAKLAILFDLPQEQGGDVGLPMFCDRSDVYLPFTRAALNEALDRVPTLTAVHPEIQSLNEDNVACAAEYGLKIATWGWKEYSPLGNTEGSQRFANAAREAFRLAAKHDVEDLAIITDHIRDMRAFIRQEKIKLL